MTGIANTIVAHPFLAAGAVAGLGVAAFAARSDYQNHKKEGLAQNAARSVSTAGGALMIGSMVPLGIYAAGRASVGSNGMVARGIESFGKYANDSFSEAFKAKGFRELITKSAIVPATFGAGIGAAIGGYVSDDTSKGAAIGAGVGAVGGLALRGAMRGMGKWKAMGKVPGLQSLALIGSAAAVATGARALAAPQYESEAVAERDDMGGYDVPQTSVKGRLARMNVTGALVFGLHRGR